VELNSEEVAAQIDAMVTDIETITCMEADRIVPHVLVKLRKNDESLIVCVRTS
jgi:hypothetical protein